MAIITVREFARLTTGRVENNSLDKAYISSADFDELCALNDRRRPGEAPLIQMYDRTTLGVCNYVGIIQTSQGTSIEILPKTGEASSQAELVHERALLIKMLRAVLELPFREHEAAHIQSFSAPLQEWVIRRFLEELYLLFKKGLCFNYNHVAEERPFLRGKLDIGKQLVQPPQKRHLLHIRHNIFSVDRPEHRLLRSALDRCIAVAREDKNFRLATSLRSIFHEIRPSISFVEDFRQWNFSRHMAHYQNIRPWCELVLGKEMPFALIGEWYGISMLFPMEKLFEKYVGVCLRRHLAFGAQLSEQLCQKYLCTLDKRAYFALRPDIAVSYKENLWLLDIKWKKLSGGRSGNFGISQQDFYQLFSYGQQYLQGRGDMALVYPYHKFFPSLAEPFYYSDSLRLWILAFDLEQDKLLMPSSCPIAEVFLW